MQTIALALVTFSMGYLAQTIHSVDVRRQAYKRGFKNGRILRKAELPRKALPAPSAQRKKEVAQ